MTTSRFDPGDLLDHLAQAGVRVRLDDTGRLRLAMPWPPDQVPEAVQPLLQELKAHRDEVAAYLAPGRVVPPARHATRCPGILPANPCPNLPFRDGTYPMDYRFSTERQEWIHDPGWWRNLGPTKRLH